MKKGLKDINPKDLIGVTKVPVHLVSPIAIIQEAAANFLGATKYGTFNWRGKRTSASVYYAAVLRHLFAWWSGEEFDSDGTPHLANARCCLAILMEGAYIGNMKDDRPPRVPINRLMKEVEEMMKVVSAKYGHMNPKHWTIVDPVFQAAPPKKPKKNLKPRRSKAYRQKTKLMLGK